MTYFLDLFAGIGGFALGAEWAGAKFDKHYFSEIDDYASRVYQKRFPGAVALGDIRKIQGIELPAGEWIIAGGFPCQDISVAGKGAGLAGERSGLWFEYARLIGELRPRYAIMENVGALTFRGLDAVLGSLAALWYDAEWQDIRASDVGAPHRRERIWIVAYPYGTRLEEHGMLDTVLSVGSSEAGTSTESIKTNVADATHSRNVRRDGQLATAQGEVRHHRGSPQDGCREWWSTEPDVGRVAHGVPSRVDRLRCLGNSIVPQIATRIFQAIMEREAQRCK